MGLNLFGNIELDYRSSNNKFVFSLGGRPLNPGDAVLFRDEDPETPVAWWCSAWIEWDRSSDLCWPQVRVHYSKARALVPFDYFACIPGEVVELLRVGREQLEAFKRVQRLLESPTCGAAAELLAAQADLLEKEEQLAAGYRKGAEVEGITVDLRSVLRADQPEREVLPEANSFSTCADGQPESCLWARRCPWRRDGAGCVPEDGCFGRRFCQAFFPVQRPWPTSEPTKGGSSGRLPGSLLEYVWESEIREYRGLQRQGAQAAAREG